MTTHLTLLARWAAAALLMTAATLLVLGDHGAEALLRGLDTDGDYEREDS